MAESKTTSISCNECGKNFTLKASLKDHVLSVHEGVRPHVCDICGKSFFKNSHLNKHILIHIGIKPYACDKCDKRFNDKYTLHQHSFMHNSVRPFSCDICGKGFIKKAKLNYHLVKHSEVRPFACGTCDKRFMQKSHLTQHVLLHKDIKPFSCEVCNKGFTQKCYLNQHLLVHKDIKPYSCVTCDKNFISNSDFNRHLRTKKCTKLRLKMGNVETEKTQMQESHTDEGRKESETTSGTTDTRSLQFPSDGKGTSETTVTKYPQISMGSESHPCHICGLNFCSKSSLSDHFMSIHGGLQLSPDDNCNKGVGEKSGVSEPPMMPEVVDNYEPYSCECCGKCFTKKLDLNRHLLIHNEKKPYFCRICDKTFIKKAYLKHHLLLHNSVKPFSCEICKKGFTKKAKLNYHLLKHKGVRPYACETCGKRFMQKSHLDQHILVHIDAKPFSCEICNKGFTQKCYLNQHLLVHQETKPYSCETCVKSFISKSDLNRHLRTKKCIKSHSKIKKERNIIGEKTVVRDDHGEEIVNISEKKSTVADKFFQCEACDKRFIKRSHLRQHLLTHTGVRPYTCETCGKKFMQKSHLDQHLPLHRDVKPYSCEVCNKGFTQKNNLNRHILVHKGLKPYAKLSIARKSFAQKCNKAPSKLTKSNSEPPMTLESKDDDEDDNEKREIKSTSDKRSSLQLSADGKSKKPYFCEPCNKRFIKKSHLNQHLLTHTGERPYSCETCGKRFFQKSHLDQHFPVHKDIKPYSCEICSKGFTQKYNLNLHLLVHKGLKPYAKSNVKRKLLSRECITNMKRNLFAQKCNKPFSKIPKESNYETEGTLQKDKDNFTSTFDNSEVPEKYENISVAHQVYPSADNQINANSQPEDILEILDNKDIGIHDSSKDQSSCEQQCDVQKSGNETHLFNLLPREDCETTETTSAPHTNALTIDQHFGNLRQNNDIIPGHLDSTPCQLNPPKLTEPLKPMNSYVLPSTVQMVTESTSCDISGHIEDNGQELKRSMAVRQFLGWDINNWK